MQNPPAEAERGGRGIRPLSVAPVAPAARGRAVPVLAWILAVALVLRAGLAVAAWLLHRDAAVFAYPDTASYLAPARELASQGSFTVNGVPELVRTPGYPLLMVPGVLLGDVTLVTIALQVALSVATCAGVYLLALELVEDRRAALFAAGIAAAEPLGVQYAALLLSECAFTALLVFALLLLVRYARRERPAHLLGGVVLLCAAAYVRPAGYPLVFLAPAFFAVRAVPRCWWAGVRHATAAGGLALGLLLPWTARNTALGYPGFSGVVPLSVYYYNAAAVLARRDGVSPDEERRRLGWLNDGVYLRLHPEQREWTHAQRLVWLGSEGARIVRGDPAGVARSHLRGVASAALGSGAGEFRSVMGVPAPSGTIAQRLRAGHARAVDVVPDLVGELFLAAVYVLSAYWLLRRRRGLSAGWLLVLGVAAYLLLIAGGVGGARFRMPVMPVVCITAGAGMALALRAASDRREMRYEYGPRTTIHPTT